MKQIIFAILLIGSFSFTLAGCTPQTDSNLKVVSTSYSHEDERYYVTLTKSGTAVTLWTMEEGVASMLTKGSTYDVTYDLDDGSIEQVKPDFGN